MTPAVRHSIVHATVIAGRNVVEKSASATPIQKQVIDASLPDGNTVELSKRASLAQILAAGEMVEN